MYNWHKTKNYVQFLNDRFSWSGGPDEIEKSAQNVAKAVFC
jgi:hypothetical protein